MDIQEAKAKRQKLLTQVFIWVACLSLAASLIYSLVVTARWAEAESALSRYVKLAGSTHASLNFYRGNTHLLKPEGEPIEAMTTTNNFVYRDKPAYSTWDRRYQEIYNEQMRAHLATNVTQLKE